MSFNQKELDELLIAARYHFAEFRSNIQAAYHCMCERGDKESIETSLELAHLIGKTDRALKTVEAHGVVNGKQTTKR
jgi:hypothetical protein